MTTDDEPLAEGIRLIEERARNRFPHATVSFLGRKEDLPRFRWTIDFGPDKAGSRLAATEGVLASPSTLQKRMADFEQEGKRLSEADVEDQWVVLSTVGIANKRPDEW